MRMKCCSSIQMQQKKTIFREHNNLHMHEEKKVSENAPRIRYV